jgi:K+/H+ antiporter YhaU regulatory subunit KhtT
VAVGGLAGKDPVSLDIRRRTGTSVVAVGRGGRVVVELGADFTFQAGDEIYLCGSEEALRRFRETFGK